MVLDISLLGSSDAIVLDKHGAYTQPNHEQRYRKKY